jgi:hypothetical protein
MPLAQIINIIISFLSNWLQGRQQLSQAKQQTLLSVEQNKARLALDTEQANSSWEMAELSDADKWIRRTSFIMFSAPFVIAIFSPISIQHYFQVALASMPEWYTRTYMSITGAVWGVSQLKNTLPHVINSLKKRPA